VRITHETTSATRKTDLNLSPSHWADHRGRGDRVGGGGGLRQADEPVWGEHARMPEMLHLPKACGQRTKLASPRLHEMEGTSVEKMWPSSEPSNDCPEP